MGSLHLTMPKKGLGVREGDAVMVIDHYQKG